MPNIACKSQMNGKLRAENKLRACLKVFDTYFSTVFILKAMFFLSLYSNNMLYSLNARSLRSHTTEGRSVAFEWKFNKTKNSSFHSCLFFFRTVWIFVWRKLIQWICVLWCNIAAFLRNEWKDKEEFKLIFFFKFHYITQPQMFISWRFIEYKYLVNKNK